MALFAHLPRSKVTGAALMPAGCRAQVLARVSEPGFEPEGLRLISRLDDFFFTAECEGDALERLASDARVISIAVMGHDGDASAR